MAEHMEITMKLNDDKGMWVLTCRWRGQLAFAMAHPDKEHVRPFFDLLTRAEEQGPSALVGAIMGIRKAAESVGASVAEGNTAEGAAMAKLIGEG
jgi:hypothetical protein